MLSNPVWFGKPIVDQGHTNYLERQAAIEEFLHKLPREQAEEKAYDTYVRLQRSMAAASHLTGMKTAAASGNKADADKHYIMYSNHMKALGYPSVGPVPQEIQVHIDNNKKFFYKFKAHPADLFAVQEQPPEPTK